MFRERKKNAKKVGNAEASAHFKQALKQAGKEVEDDVEIEEWRWEYAVNAATERHPEIPFCVEHIWDIFMELHAGRNNNGYGPLPLNFVEIKSWCDLNRYTLTAFEIAAIRRLDTIYIEVASEEEQK